MSYTNTLYHLTFDTLPLTDPVGNTVVTTGSPSLVDGIFGNALNLDRVEISTASLSMTNKFGIGFWLKPKNQGLAENPSHVTDSLHQAVLCQSQINYSAGQFVANAPTVIIYEETQQNNQNKLVVIIEGLSAGLSVVSRKIESSPYNCDEWHHFFINYNGVTPSLTLYVDLVADAGTTTGTVPATLNTSSTGFTINKSVPGYTYQAVQNTGVIDDLVVFNTDLMLTDIQRVANMGALYVADTAYSAINEIHQGFIVDDPSTVQITSVFANRGNVYVGRTDGKLLRGVRSLWESRHEFADPEEINAVNVVNKTVDNDLSVNNGVLTIKNEVIRI